MRQALRSPVKTLVEGFSYWRKNGARIRRAQALCQCGDAMRLRRVRRFEVRSLAVYRKASRSLDGLGAFDAEPTSDVAVAAHRALALARRPYRAATAAGLVVTLALILLGYAAIAAGALFSVGLRARFFPRDLAAHRPWVAINAEPGYPSSGTGPSTDGPLLFHTTFIDGPWIEIDLGGDHTLTGFQVENRADCCKERALPLNVEVFRNGAWQLVAQRRAPFSTWSYDLAPVHASRVRLVRPGRNFFHLKRISVYGR